MKSKVVSSVSVNVEINGAAGEVPAGSTILEAARARGVEIPTLCNDERLTPCGACRMCLVEVEGARGLVTACQTKVQDGMRITTHGPRAEHSRRMTLEMLARRYPRAEFLRYPDKPFHALARRYGLGAPDFAAVADSGRRSDDSHAYIRVEMSRCVDCYACVRICDELQGRSVWRIAGRGAATEIVWDRGATFAESSCVACGACADVCPTGALEDKSVLARGNPESWTKTVCPYCGTGCELAVGVRADRLVQIKPVTESPVSRGHLCVKGRYAFDFVDAPDRVTDPLIRRRGAWEKVSWDAALEFTAGELRRIGAEYGREAIAVLGSARATNEENYVTQKFVRVGLGTNNVDCCARVCHTPTAAAMKLMLGTGAATNSFDDIEMARTFLIGGANPTENHPIVGARIRRAVRAGAHLIVVDPRRTELAKIADVHLPVRPGTNILLFNALAHTIVAEGLADREFIDGRVDEFAEFAEFIEKFAPEAVAERCGVEASAIRRAARLYATAKPSMCFHGLGMTEHVQGTEGVMTIVNLALLTGNLGRRGAGVNPLRGQNNVQGAAHMGCDPGVLTGGIGLDDGRARFESVWGAPVPTAKGYNQLQMMDAARAGRLKALWVIGYDVFLTNADAERTAASLADTELVVVQDLFLNETAKRFGTVFFPAASSFEKDGTFMNAERRVSLLRPAVRPRGNSLPDWQIVCRLARAAGFGEHFAFESSEAIWNEIRKVWPGAAGITYARLKQGGLQWGCPDESHPGTEVLHTESFPNGARAALRRVEYRPTKETVSADFPFLLTTGRTLYHFNAGTMTARTPNREIRPSDRLDIAPEDAAALGLTEGEIVTVRSAYGAARLPAHITGDVRRGELFGTFHSPEIFLNRLTGPHRDRFVLAPEFKVTAVRLEKTPVV